MALLQVNFMSNTLKRTVPMNVILPVDKIFASDYETKETYKTLYLLHGLLGNYMDWITSTQIQSWAEQKNLAVVMPSGDNSFYVNQVTANSDYGAFVGKELVDITRKMFPLSHNREDTFIAGLSMGGFGAIRNGLKYHETFGYIAGLSSAIQIFEMPVGEPGRVLMNEDSCFGDIKAASKTDKNPRVILEELKAKAVENPDIHLPKMYLACGLQDTLLVPNRRFRDYLEESGMDVTYREAEGNHDWNFWNSQIREVLAWLPLEEDHAGLNSGNVI